MARGIAARPISRRGATSSFARGRALLACSTERRLSIQWALAGWRAAAFGPSSVGMSQVEPADGLQERCHPHVPLLQVPRTALPLRAGTALVGASAVGGGKKYWTGALRSQGRVNS